jgi:hypothetical protein
VQLAEDEEQMVFQHGDPSVLLYSGRSPALLIIQR